MADEERCKIAHTVLQDRWLFRIVEQPIVTSNS
jgi:hypothetical protein